MFQTRFISKLVRILYGVALPALLIGVIVSKPFVLFGVQGYYSALLAPITAFSFFILTVYVPEWRREVVFISLVLVGVSIGALLAISFLPIMSESPVDRDTWSRVIWGGGLDRVISVCVSLVLVVVPWGLRRWATHPVKKVVYATLDLCLYGWSAYALVGVGVKWWGDPAAAMIWWGSASWFVGSTLVMGLFALLMTYYILQRHYTYGAGDAEESLDRSVYIYTRVLAVFLVTLLLTNIVSIRYVRLGRLPATAGLFIYPLTFFLTDLISELYGRSRATEVVMTGFQSSVWGSLLIGGMLSVHGEAALDHCFALFFSFTPGMILGSMVAYLVGQWLDVSLFHFLKQSTHGRYLWLRNNVATITSQWVDTVVFGLFTWVIWPFLYVGGKSLSGQMGWKIWSGLMLTEGICKTLIAFLDTPFLYLILYLLRSPSEDAGKR